MAISKSFLDLVGGRARSYSSSASFGYNRSVRRRNVVYSNELVKDVKLLRRCRSLESIDIFIDNKINELETIEALSNKFINDLSIKNRRALEIQRRVSLEAANLYYYSLEAMPDIKGAAAAAGEGIKKFFEKLLAIIIGFGKRIASWINGFFVKRYNKFYKDFNVAKFQNLDAKVNVPPIPQEVVKKLQTATSSKGIAAVQKLSKQITEGQNINTALLDHQMTDLINSINPNEIFAEIFGNSELKGMPKSREMTVSEFFHGAKKGQKPKMLEVLSPATKAVWDSDIKGIKELSAVCKAAMNKIKDVNSANKDDKEGMKQYNKAASTLKMALTKMQARRFNDFNAKAKIAGVIYSVAKTGLGEVKEEKKEGKK